MPDKILIVEDDSIVASMLSKVVLSNGLSANVVSSGEDALEDLSVHSYDLILMDINLNGIDGFQVIQSLREKNIQTPIIIVSGRTEDIDTLYGLNIGADDYITKPFNPITLGAKIKALIRRSRNTLSNSNHEIVAGPFTYNTSTLHLYKNGEEIPLSAKEHTLMRLFLDNANHIFSKDMIYELVWGNAIVDDNAVMVYVNRLRHKIEDNPSSPKYLINVRGLGYRFVV